MMHADRPASRKLSGHFDWRLTAISTGPARAGSVTWHNFRDHKYSEPLGHTVTVDGNSWLSKSSLKRHACLKAGYAACIAAYSVVLRVGTLGRSDALAPCVLDVFEIHSWCRVLTPGAARKTARTNCVCAALRGRPPCAPGSNLRMHDASSRFDDAGERSHERATLMAELISELGEVISELGEDSGGFRGLPGVRPRYYKA